jgi:sec-independent protein translocase protein TatC
MSLTKKTTFSDTITEFRPYLHELKRESIKILIVFTIGFTAGAVYYQEILKYLMSFFNLTGINLVLTSPYQFIGFSVKTGLMTGSIVAFPFFLYSFLKFIRPALEPKEYKLILQLLPLSLALFLTGFVFGIWVVQFVIDLYSQTTSGFQIENIWDLSGFLSQILLAGFSLAFVFQLPIILTIFIRLKLLTISAIKKQRKIIYTVLIIAAAILSPGVDMISFIIFTLVSLFLFEFTLLLNRKS